MPSSPFDPPNLEDERGQRRLVANVKKAMSELKGVYPTASDSSVLSDQEHANDLHAILESEIAELRNKSSDGWTEGVTTVIDDAEKAMTECPKLVLTESAMNGAGNRSMSRQEDDAVELTEEQRKEAIDDAVKRLKAAMNLVEVAISAETRGSDIQIQQKRALMLTRKKEVEKLAYA